MARWDCIIPILPARDVRESQEWYRDTLGLGINWIWEDNFGSVGMDNVELFLAQTDDPQPGRASIFVDDVDAMYASCREHEADICEAIENKPWNVREFSVRDPDGNVFRIGTAVENPTPRPEFSFPESAA
jgi:catechol 2,3-dioxygenase-like lactoylglutathione lyase family enzyme